MPVFVPGSSVSFFFLFFLVCFSLFSPPLAVSSTSLLAFALESIVDVLSSFFVVWRFWGTWGKVGQNRLRGFTVLFIFVL